MKYYSETLKKIFDSEDDLKKAEEAYEEENQELIRKKEAKAARLKEIDDAYKAYEESIKKYNDLVNKFVKDYGYYHKSVKGALSIPTSFYDFFLNNWPW